MAVQHTTTNRNPSTDGMAKQDGKPAFRELGVTGLRRQGGVIVDEPLRALRGERGRRTYREMASTDDMVRALLRAIEMLIRQLDWREEPGEPSRAAERDAEWLAEVREDMSHTWEDFISEVLTFLVYGWSYFETVYKLRQGVVRNSPGESSRFDDGTIGIRKLAPRSQLSLVKWEFDEDGGVQGMWQRDPNAATMPIFIPIEKALLFRAGPHGGSPEGESVLRGAWLPWYHKKKIRTMQSIGVERDNTGVAVAWVPPEVLATNASAADRRIFQEVQEIVTNLRRDEQEGIIWPQAYDEKGQKLYDLTLLGSPGPRQMDTRAILQDLDRAIASVFLGDFMMVGHEGTGSYSLHSDKTALFAVALGAWADSIQEVLNRHLVPRLFAINGWSREVLPRWVHGDIEKMDLGQLATIVRELATSGMALFPDEALEDHLRDLLNFPPRSVEMDEMLEPEPEPEPAMPEGDEAEAEAAEAETGAATPAGEAVT